LAEKYKLGSMIKPLSIKCGIPKCEWVSGINIFKRFMPSRNIGADTTNYLIVPPGGFALNLMHVGRDKKIPVAMNDKREDAIVSGAYNVFSVIDESILLSEYLRILITSSEFDRYAAYCTDSSVRDGLEWKRFCEIEVTIPPLNIQKQFVAIYRALLDNQIAYENGLENLKLACNAFIDGLRKEIPAFAIGDCLEQIEMRNTYGLGAEQVRGLAVSKEIIKTKADMQDVSLDKYKTMPPKSIAYVSDTSRRGDKMSLGYNNTCEAFLVSAISTVFTTHPEKLMPEYLMLFFSRSEFDRYARFNSWGSARETFSWEDMLEVKIPIPDIDIQRSIVNIYKAYDSRRDINEQLKERLKDICPILIKGSLEESGLFRHIL
jgi:type I restriction enzyme S subunit